MKRLIEYAIVVNSQFGEDGMIREVLKRLGTLEGHRLAVEVGASDGRECSNTLELRDTAGWWRIQIESDPLLVERAEVHHFDKWINAEISPTGLNSIDSLCSGEIVEFLSLDIDGDEYRVLENLQMRPNLIVAEFNQTIPWHLDIHSSALGCSLRSMVRLMTWKDYFFIGATQCNAFFVPVSRKHCFEDLDTDPQNSLAPENCTYLISSPYGGVVAFGPQIFGVQKRFTGEIDYVTPDGETKSLNLTHRATRPN